MRFTKEEWRHLRNQFFYHCGELHISPIGMLAPHLFPKLNQFIQEYEIRIFGEYTIYWHPDGLVVTAKNDSFDSVNGQPSVVCPDGHIVWLKSDREYRDNGPSVLYSNGSIGWFLYGRLSRKNSPSLVYDDYKLMWCDVSGLTHRENGPAIISPDGYMEWWQYGKLHRVDGPSIIKPDGSSEWWINDENITDKVNEWMEENDIDYPFTSKELMLFQLTFC